MENVREEKLTTEDMARARTLRSDPEHPDRDRPNLTKAAPSDTAPADTAPEQPNPLLAKDETAGFRTRWQNIQTGFVDEPRQAVKQADELVAEIMQQLAQSFSDQRRTLESEWEHSDKVSTEELRMALRRYRSFFDRLLSL